MVVWAIAVIVEYASPALAFWTPWLGKTELSALDVEGGHMAERAGLFIIIALGESILVTGATFANLSWSLVTIAAFAICLAGSIAMWWLYFDTSVEAGSHNLARREHPGALARLAYTYIHLIIVAGIILSAVGDEFVLHHPTGHADARTTIAVGGSAAIYLLGNLLFKRAVLGRTPWSHAGGIAVIAALSFVSRFVPPMLFALAVTIVLIVVAGFERTRCRPLIEAGIAPR
jgi:low temperature requirement protein LtrA